MKNWIDLQTQVQRHLNRGLELGEITERDFALFLYSSNYYRVSGYGRCFYQPNSDRYAAGTTAEQLITIYDLDRRIRNLILDGISVVEPTVRTRVAYHVAKVIGGSRDYLEENLYLPIDQTPPIGNDRELSRWEAERKNRQIVLKEFKAIQQLPEIFIQHHLRKGNPIPFWAAIEVVSLGTFSRFLRALRDPDLLRPVTQSLDIEDERKFLQAIQNITYLRNIAAPLPPT